MTFAGSGKGHGAVRDRLQARLAASGGADQEAAFFEAVFRLRARRLATVRTRLDDRPAGTAVLSFRIAGENYAIPLADLSEVMPLGLCTPVPGLPQQLLGVVNVRGEIRPVLDLHSMLSLPEPEADARAYLIFLDHEGVEVGLRVDELERISFVETDSLTVPHESANGLPQRFVAGITPDTLVLLDARQILALDILQDRRADYRRVS